MAYRRPIFAMIAKHAACLAYITSLAIATVCDSADNASCIADGLIEAVDQSGRPVPVLIDPLEVASRFGDHPDLWKVDKYGLPTKMRIFTVSEDPWIAVVPKFLSDAEMEHLIEISEERWKRSEIGRNSATSTALEKDDTAFKPAVSETRTSYSNFLEYELTGQVKFIEQRLAAVTGISVHHIEPLAMVRYRPGEIFDEHHDGGFRQRTVFIYLNDLPDGDGGETLFPELGFKFMPRRGCAVVWSNNDGTTEEPSMRMLHQGLPPKTATKYAVNVFFNVKPIRQTIMATEQVKRGEIPDLPLDHPLLTLMDSEDMVNKSAAPEHLSSFMVHVDPRLILAPRLLSQEEAAAVRAAGPAPVLAEQPEERAVLLQSAWTRVGLIAGMSADYMQSWMSTFTPETVAEGPAAVMESVGWKVVYVFLDDDFEGGEVVFPGLFQKVRPRLGTGISFSTHSDDGSLQPLLTYKSLPPTSGTKSVAIFSFGFTLAVHKLKEEEEGAVIVSDDNSSLLSE